MKRVEKSKVNKLVALKSLALSLSKLLPEFLIDQNSFLPGLSYTFSKYMFLTAVRHEVNDLQKLCCHTRIRISNKSCFIGFYMEFR